MRFLVLNGSPKSELSVTLQYVRYLEQRFEQHDFEVVQLAREVRKLERDPERLAALIERMAAADGLVWSWPVYYFLVPAQLKQFIELLFAAGADRALEGRIATSLTTSIHFFDHTAHDYMHAVGEDLGLEVFAGLSAEMMNLVNPTFRQSLERWFEELVRVIEQRAPLARRFAPVKASTFRYKPGRFGPSQPPSGRRIVLISDAGERDDNLLAMERVLAALLGGDVERLSLAEMNLAGGCRGCLQCGWDGRCVYKDGFEQLYRERILDADALIFSGAVRDRYLSAGFKRFFDRSFFLGHRPELDGKLMLWLISGPLRQLDTLRAVLEGYAGVARANLVGTVSDEVERSAELTALLAEAADKLIRGLDRPLRRPRMFPAVAGSKLFRDFVYLATALFRADDRYYRRHGVYDFPHKQLGRLAGDRLLRLALHLPPLRSKVQRDMRRLMLRPFEKIVGPVPKRGST